VATQRPAKPSTPVRFRSSPWKSPANRHLFRAAYRWISLHRSDFIARLGGWFTAPPLLLPKRRRCLHAEIILRPRSLQSVALCLPSLRRCGAACLPFRRIVQLKVVDLRNRVVFRSACPMFNDDLTPDLLSITGYGRVTRAGISRRSSAASCRAGPRCSRSPPALSARTMGQCRHSALNGPPTPPPCTPGCCSGRPPARA
jgi:hypothetical protein